MTRNAGDPTRRSRASTPFGAAIGRFGAEAAAVAAAIVIYARSVAFGLVFDDHSLIGEHGPRVLGGEWLPYRPLRYASLWLDYRIGGGAPWAYHATNVALHALAGALVVRLCRRAGAGGLLALAAGLVFVCHPLTVEAVAYVAGRRDLLTAVFGLGALIAWSSASGRAAWAIAGVMLAVAAKEVGVLFVPLLLVASACGIGPPPRRAFGTLAFAAVAAVTLPVAYGAQGPLAPRGALGTKLAVAGNLAAHYGRNLLGAGPLSVEYPALRCASEACADLSKPAAFAGLLLLAVMAAAAGAGVLRAARARGGGQDWRAFALAWVTIWLAALSFVVGMHEPGADRHAYVVVAATAVAVAACAARARPALQTAVVVALFAACVPFALRCGERVAVWQSDLALWRAAAATSSSARVHHNLAAALAENGRFGSARRHLARAGKIDPSYWPSLLGFAGIDCARGRFAAADVRVAEARALGATGEEVARVLDHCAAVKPPTMKPHG
jgi:hypothetical protein